MSKEIVFLVLHLGTGGAERVICNLANLLCSNYKVKIISTYKLDETPCFHLNEKVKIEYLITDLSPNKEQLKKAIKDFNLINIFKEGFNAIKILILKKKLMIKAIKKLECDIAISTRIFHNKLLGKYGNKKIIKIAQEHNYNKDKKNVIKVIKSLKKIDYFMPVSKDLAEFYKDKLENTKIKYIPNFIENLPDKTSSLQNKQLLSVGRLDKIKGFDDLIDIFNDFQKDHTDWKLHIVGDGAEKQNLQNKIQELNLQEKVILCGNKLSNELLEEYYNSSVYLMTSHSESFGLVLVEAASFGLPLIVFDSAKGAAQIVKNNKNGFLIKNRDKKVFLDKLNDLLENPQKMKLFSNEALITAKQYSKDNISKMWVDFLEKILEKHNEDKKGNY